LIRQHLKEVFASHVFAGSKRTQDFLELIVNHALEGEFDQLRERMIGAEMFGRPISYDTGSDSVVRVKATDVRKKLAQFYAETKEQPPIRIELPSGSYVPRFHFEQPHPPAPPKTENQNPTVDAQATQQEWPLRATISAKAADTSQSAAPKLRLSPLLLIYLTLGMVAVAAIGYVGFKKWFSDSSSRSGIHSIVILPLENLSGDPTQDYFADVARYLSHVIDELQRHEEEVTRGGA